MENIMKILFVDDDQIILTSAERALIPEGYTVEGVLNGKEAMEKIEQNNYDLVFTDLKMPGIDGISLIRWIRQFRPNIGIVVMTGYLLPETIKEAHKLGIIVHMMKPFTPEALKNITNETIEWIRKNALENELKEEFPSSMLEELDDIIHQYRNVPSSAILVMLHVQEIFGHLSPALQKRIAKGLNLYPSEIHSIVSFYPCFRTKPKDDYIASHTKGSARTLKGIVPKTGKRVTDAVNEYIKLRHPAKDKIDEATRQADALEKAAKEEISSSMLAELDKVIYKYRNVPGSSTPVLLHAQEIFGYLSPVVQERIAKGLNIYPSEIRSIVSFYPYFRTKPEDERLPCHIMGSRNVWRDMPLKTGRKIENAVNEFIRMRQEEHSS